LGDELGLGFQRLPRIRVERAFGDVVEHADHEIPVALAQDASLALFNVRRTPRGIEMMEGDEPFLHVRARPHLLGAAEENADLAGANILEQRQLRGIRIVVLDEGNLALGSPVGGGA
jgi:hypothetical protein